MIEIHRDEEGNLIDGLWRGACDRHGEVKALVTKPEPDEELLVTDEFGDLKWGRFREWVDGVKQRIPKSVRPAEANWGRVALLLALIPALYWLFSLPNFSGNAARGGSLRLGRVTRVAEGPVVCLEVDHNGDVFSGDAEGKVVVWRKEKSGAWRRIQTLLHHKNWVTSLAVAANGSLVSGDADGQVEVWRRLNGEFRPTNSVQACRRWVSDIAVTSSGDVVVAGGTEIGVWRFLRGGLRRVQRLVGHERSVTCMVAAVGGGLITGDRAGKVVVWKDTQSSGLTWSYVLDAHREKVSDLAVLPSGRLVTAGGSDLRLWNEQRGRYRAAAILSAMQMDHSRAKMGAEELPYRITRIRVAASGMLAISDRAGSVGLWNPAQQGREYVRTVAQHQNWVDALCVSSDGAILSGDRAGRIGVWSESSDHGL